MNQPQLQNLKNLFSIVKNSNNPTAMLNQMLMNNPQLKQAMDYINSNGGDARQAFFNLAKQKGIDPEEILKQFY